MRRGQATLAILACAAAGVLAGALLLWIYEAMPPELARVAANRRVAEFLRPLFTYSESARLASQVLGLLVLALPGGTVLGALTGFAMARVRYPRLLCYGALLWPAWVLAASQYHYAVSTAGSSSVQYHAWLARNHRLADTAAMLSVFFIVAYASRRLLGERVIESRA